MQEILGIDLSRPLPKIKLDGGERYRRVPKPKPAVTRVNDELEDAEFTRDFIDRKCEELSREISQQRDMPYNSSILTSYDHIEAYGLDAGKSLEEHGKYLAEPNRETTLPISASKQKILRYIRSGQVTIINAATGSGKTTQVPQYVLDDCFERNEECNIVISQPRRIAAVTIANRVCHERGWSEGGICGFKIGQNQVISQETRLLYCTTGVLLQRLIHRRTISDFTHIFLDEIHERSQDMDFVLLIIRLLLRDSKTKIILMSATMDNVMFINYFNAVNPGATNAIQIDGGVRFPITTYYLDNLSNGRISLGAFDSQSFAELFVISKSVCIDILQATEKERSSVLIFLPGLMEIRDLHDELVTLPQSAGWKICILHSSIPYEDQAMVMRTYETKIRKIILATNIAESSITVPDVEIVIDFCMAKSLQVDRGTESVSLQLRWISQHEGTQRQGRVGRVAPGRVYRLVPASTYESFYDRSEPEMLTSPIEATVLRAKMLRFSDPISVLSQAIEPPRIFDIRRAIRLLKEAGALTHRINGVYSDCDGDLTFLGIIMGRLPLNYQEAKLVALGYACGVLEESAIVAAYLTLHRLFVFPFMREVEAYKSLRTWADNSQCDAIAALTAFQAYREKSAWADLTRGSGASAKSWANQCFLQLRTLKEMEVLVQDLMGRLRDLTVDLPTEFLKQDQSDLRRMILKFVIAGAFYGNYFSASNGQDEENALRELNNINPLRTVCFSGFPRNHVGEVYGKQILDYFENCSLQVTPCISFYCERVLVEFPAVAKKEQKAFGVRYEPIQPEMYLAVYKSIRKMNLTLSLLNAEDNERLARECGLVKKKAFLALEDPSHPIHRREVTNLPDINEHRIYFRIIKLINPGHFMAAYDPPRMDELCQKFQTLKLDEFQHKPLDGRPGIGCVYLAVRKDVFVRLRVEEFYERSDEVQVLYIDIGNRQRIDLSALYIPDEKIANEVYNTPAYVFECRLAKIEPGVDENCARKWSPLAYQLFLDSTQDAALNGVVYSVVDGVVRLELFAIHGQDEICINQLLVSHNFAVKAKESFESENNHKARVTDHLNKDALRAFAYTQRMQLRLPPPVYPDLSQSTMLKKVKLVGPRSPLRCTVTSISCGKGGDHVTVGPASVNAVIFNTWPEDSRGMLLIGHGRMFRNINKGVTIKSSTLMPDIRGLECLIPVLFAPRVQLRPDPVQVRYASALCGMGIREDGRPIYPENDFNVVFDTEFNNDDLKMVNHMRELISKLLYTSNDLQMFQNYSRTDYIQGVNAIQRSFSKLLIDRPPKQKIFPDTETALHWDRNIIVDDDRVLYPKIQALDLRDKREVYRQLTHAYHLGRRETPFTPTACPLCNDFFVDVDSLYRHNQTLRHKNLENAFFD